MRRRSRIELLGRVTGLKRCQLCVHTWCQMRWRCWEVGDKEERARMYRCLKVGVLAPRRHGTQQRGLGC